MPWWLILYLSGYAVFTVHWVRDDIRGLTPMGLIAASLASEACMVMSALGFWLPQVRLPVENFAILIFVAGFAWLLLACIRDIRAYPFDPSLSFRVNIIARALGLVFYSLASGPLIYWGYMFAVLGRRSGT